MFREGMLQVVQEWPAYSAAGKVDSKSSVHRLVTKDLPEYLWEWADKDPGYLMKGSDGLGQLAATPWVAALNKQVTASAMSGYYLVYLLSDDLKRLVLALGLGATQFTNVFGKTNRCLQVMDNAVSKLSLLIEARVTELGSTDGAIEVGVKPDLTNKAGFSLLRAYERGTLVSRTYNLVDLPADELLEADFRMFRALYEDVISSVVLTDIESFLVDAASEPRESQMIAYESFVPERRTLSQRSPKSVRTPTNSARSSRADYVGRKGEEFVFQQERLRLVDAGRSDLAAQVILHRDHENRTPGWDITSFDLAGNEVRIEVKTSVGSKVSAVNVTANEWHEMQKARGKTVYRLYLVTNILGKPRIRVMEDPASLVDQDRLTLEVDVYKLSFQG